jgi:hypothetical protein
MSRRSREKGRRTELAIARLLQDRGIAAERVLLERGSGRPFSIYARGSEVPWRNTLTRRKPSLNSAATTPCAASASRMASSSLEAWITTAGGVNFPSSSKMYNR